VKPRNSRSPSPPSLIHKHGKIDVPMDRYYGAQTARFAYSFRIGQDTMPPERDARFRILKNRLRWLNRDLGKNLPVSKNAQPDHPGSD